MPAARAGEEVASSRRANASKLSASAFGKAMDTLAPRKLCTAGRGRSPSSGTLAIVGTEAVPTGKATLNGVGNHGFLARIIDNGEPGVNDRFGLRVTAPNGSIVIDLTFDPIQLSGCNFSVPKLTGK